MMNQSRNHFTAIDALREVDDVLHARGKYSELSGGSHHDEREALLADLVNRALQECAPVNASVVQAKVATLANCEIGDVLLRVVPPECGRPGYSQAGVVSAVTDDVIELSIQADIIRCMKFNRADGRDLSGIGSYLVPQDLTAQQYELMSEEAIQTSQPPESSARPRG